MCMKQYDGMSRIVAAGVDPSLRRHESYRNTKEEKLLTAATCNAGVDSARNLSLREDRPKK